MSIAGFAGGLLALLLLTVPAALSQASCSPVGSGKAYVDPTLVQTLTGWPGISTAWFAPTVLIDLDQNGSPLELIIPTYNIEVRDSKYNVLQLLPGQTSPTRVYAPVAVGDIDNNGKLDIVACRGSSSPSIPMVEAWEWNTATRNATLKWQTSVLGTSTGCECRGLSVADVNLDGYMEIAAVTTDSSNPQGKAPTWLLDHTGSVMSGWPRYNYGTGPTEDGHRNCGGVDGQGGFGLSVGIGNVDDTPDLEIIGTYDDHLMSVYKPNGVSLQTSSYYSVYYWGNASCYANGPVGATYGQLVRGVNETTEECLYHFNTPVISPNCPALGGSGSASAWLEWTQAPPSVYDLDGDGKNEIMGAPFWEENYVYQKIAIMVMYGAYGWGANSALGEGAILPHGDYLSCGPTSTCTSGLYAPSAIAIADVVGDSHPELMLPLSDCTIRCYSYQGQQLWSFNYCTAASPQINPDTYAVSSSEPVVADLNQDGKPEVLFTTFGANAKPMSSVDSLNLYVLNGQTGAQLSKINFVIAGNGNGNGNGAPASPAVADIDLDGTLEIVINTFDGRVLVYNAPNSATNCVLWATARGGNLRKGQPDSYNAVPITTQPPTTATSTTAATSTSAASTSAASTSVAAASTAAATSSASTTAVTTTAFASGGTSGTSTAATSTSTVATSTSVVASSTATTSASVSTSAASTSAAATTAVTAAAAAAAAAAATTGTTTGATVSPPTTGSNSVGSGGSSLSGGVIAGIVIGVLVALVLLGVAGFFIWRKCASQSSSSGLKPVKGYVIET